MRIPSEGAIGICKRLHLSAISSLLMRSYNHVSISSSERSSKNWTRLTTISTWALLTQPSSYVSNSGLSQITRCQGFRSQAWRDVAVGLAVGEEVVGRVEPVAASGVAAHISALQIVVVVAAHREGGCAPGPADACKADTCQSRREGACECESSDPRYAVAPINEHWLILGP